MAKTKVSEWDVVADNNQDISGITLGTGMPPSYVNDSIREMMAQLKDWQSGSSGDDYTITGNLGVNGTLTINGSSGTSGQVLVSQGDGAVPKWGDAFVTGMIMLWSGSTSSVPSGWKLCNGSSGTPDLRDKFVVGAGNSYDVNATGGSPDAAVIKHSHPFSANTTSDGEHTHSVNTYNNQNDKYASKFHEGGDTSKGKATIPSAGAHTHTVSGVSSQTGVEGANKNLPPYYALAYIMKV